jgi:hypothetical protein
MIPHAAEERPRSQIVSASPIRTMLIRGLSQTKTHALVELLNRSVNLAIRL